MTTVDAAALFQDYIQEKAAVTVLETEQILCVESECKGVR